MGYIPSVEKLVAFIDEFFAVLQQLSQGDRIDVARAWDSQTWHLLQHPHLDPWSVVVDSVGAAVATVLQAGWKPLRPDTFET